MDRDNILRQARLGLAVCALGALALTSGCIAAVAGGTAVYMELAQKQMAAGPAPVAVGMDSYTEGSLVASFPAGVGLTARAVNAAFSQLGYPKVSERGDELGDTLVARTGNDKRLEIKLEAIGSGLTKVTIRVGAFGDEGLSRSILGKIKANLGGGRPGPDSPTAVAS